jgi:uncharacterized membrane protein
MTARKVGRIVVHSLLFAYAAILVYVILGLVVNLNIGGDVFFDLSFALLFFTLGQAFYELGFRRALIFLVVTALVGFVAEVLGTSTGFPFGQYFYSDILGPKIVGVPEVVPLVWFVIAYLAYSISRVVSGTKANLLGIALLSAFGAVSWDFMVDPMFSSYGYWTWTKQFLPLPKLAGIPLTNFVGWFVVLTLMIIIYFATLRKKDPLGRRNTLDSRVAYALLMVDGIIANYELQNGLVILIGALSMSAFLTISIFYERKYTAKVTIQKSDPAR